MRGAIECLFRSGFAAVPRGLRWGLLGIPAGAYCCLTFPYGGGIIAGPAVALAGFFAGAWIAFHLGAVSGLYRDGYRWAIPFVVALAAAEVVTPYAIYERGERRRADCAAGGVSDRAAIR